MSCKTTRSITGRGIITCIALILAASMLCHAEQYQSLWNYETDSAPVYIDAADLEGDGFTEVVVVSSQSNILGSSGWVYVLGNDGSLKKKYNLPGGIRPETCLIEDMDGDGKKEILLAVFSSVYMLKGNADDTVPKKMSIGMIGGEVKQLIATDLEGDGKKELVISMAPNRGEGEIYIYDHFEEGNPRKRYSVDTDYNIYGITVTDLDGNGEKEIIAATSDRLDERRPGNVIAFNKNLSKDKTLWQHPTGSRVWTIESADLEGDGSPEIILGGNGYVEILDRNGKLKANRSMSESIDTILVAELDGRGGREIIFAGESLYCTDAKLGLRWTNKTVSGVYDITTADLEGDGNIEVIASLYVPSRGTQLESGLQVYDKDGKITWYAPDAKYSVRTARIVDITYDDHPEIMFGGYSDGVLHVLEPTSYVKRYDANRVYREAQNLYTAGKFEEARAKAAEAKALYMELDDLGGISQCNDLVDMIGSGESDRDEKQRRAEDIYAQAQDAYDAGEYILAAQIAQNASNRFRDLSDVANRGRADELIRLSKESLKYAAEEQYGNASAFYEACEYEKALEYAAKAYASYEYINDKESMISIDRFTERVEETWEEKRKQERIFGLSVDQIIITATAVVVISVFTAAIVFFARKKQETHEGMIDTAMEEHHKTHHKHETHHSHKTHAKHATHSHTTHPASHAHSAHKHAVHHKTEVIDEMEKDLSEKHAPAHQRKASPVEKMSKDRFRGEGVSLRGLAED